jgi:hypothetical protein
MTALQVTLVPQAPGYPTFTTTVTDPVNSSLCHSGPSNVHTTVTPGTPDCLYYNTSTLPALAVCEVSFLSQTDFPLDVPYLVKGIQTYEDGSSEPFLFTAQNGRPLAFINSAVVTPFSARVRYGIPDDAAACHPASQQAIGIPQTAYSGAFTRADLTQFYANVDLPQTLASKATLETNASSNSGPSADNSCLTSLYVML